MEVFLCFLVMVICGVVGILATGGEGNTVEDQRNSDIFAGQVRKYERHVSPRGAVYVITDSGKKRYLRQNGTKHPRRRRY